MAFELGRYTKPDFTEKKFVEAPDAVLAPAPRDKAAPENFHAMSIFPEYFKVKGEWILPEDSRMDCVAVYEDGRIFVREFRNLKKGDLCFLGRTENCEEGIYVHDNGFTFPGRMMHRQIPSPSDRAGAEKLHTPMITATSMSFSSTRETTDI